MFKKIMIKATDDTDDTFKPVPTFFLTDNPHANTRRHSHKYTHPATHRHTHLHQRAQAYTGTHSDAYAYISTCKPILSRSLTLNCKHTLSLFYLVVTQNLSLSHTTVISQDHKPAKGCLLENE